MAKKVRRARAKATVRQEAPDEFDREFVADTFSEPSPAALRKWRHAVRGPGRPLRGAGVKVISVSVEKTLLARTDSMARALGISRAELIARGLRAALAASGAA